MEATNEVTLAAPTRTTLAAVPERTSRLIRAIAHNPRIRTALAHEGYTDEDHQEGWRLYHEVQGFIPLAQPTPDLRAALALAELDRIDGPLIDKIDATLGHRFPVQRAAVLAGVVPGEHAAAVANVKLVVERVETLAASADAQDQAAVARLAKVRLDAAERERLAGLVALAESFESESGAGYETEEERWARVEPQHVALWRWLDEWSRAARRAIGRRDWLIALGLAKRKTKAKANGPVAPPEA